MANEIFVKKQNAMLFIYVSCSASKTQNDTQKEFQTFQFDFKTVISVSKVETFEKQKSFQLLRKTV